MPQLRVIDEAGGNIGVLSLQDAKREAESRGLDLILIVATANPPVARIISYDKFRYIKEKELKKQRAMNKAPEQKQIQISAREAENDLKTKIGKMEKFIGNGHRIEIVMRLRGREKGMKDYCKGKLEEFMKMIPFPYKVVQSIGFDGKSFTTKIDPTGASVKTTNTNEEKHIEENKDN